MRSENISLCLRTCSARGSTLHSSSTYIFRLLCNSIISIPYINHIYVYKQYSILHPFNIILHKLSLFLFFKNYSNTNIKRSVLKLLFYFFFRAAAITLMIYHKSIHIIILYQNNKIKLNTILYIYTCINIQISIMQLKRAKSHCPYKHAE